MLSCSADVAAAAVVAVAVEGTSGDGGGTSETEYGADRKGEEAKVPDGAVGQNLKGKTVRL